MTEALKVDRVIPLLGYRLIEQVLADSTGPPPALTLAGAAEKAADRATQLTNDELGQVLAALGEIDAQVSEIRQRAAGIAASYKAAVEVLEQRSTAGRAIALAMVERRGGQGLKASEATWGWRCWATERETIEVRDASKVGPECKSYRASWRGAEIPAPVREMLEDVLPIREEVLKTAILEEMKRTGVIPEGCELERRTSLSIARVEAKEPKEAVDAE